MLVSAADREIAMKAMSKAASLLAISTALTLSGNYVFAGTGSPGQVKTSGTSAAPSGSGAGDSKYTCCHHPHPSGGNFYHPPPGAGATGGNDPNPNRGPGNPTLHPK